MSHLLKQMVVLLVSTVVVLPTYALDGGTLILTQTGHKAIKDIQVGDLVLSKNEITNQSNYQSVSNLCTNQYNETVHLTVSDDIGNIQVLKTNKTHPFFVQSDDITSATEGYIYKGDIINADWTDANSLKVGDKLLSDNDTWQTVQSVKVSQEPITAYNLTVNNNHTFFVKAENGKYGVLVHNKRKKFDNTNNTNKQENPALSNLSKPLSKTTIDHLMDRHNYHRVKIQFNTLVNKQGKTKEQAYQILNLGNRTFFNKSWDEQKILSSIDYVKKDAISKNILKGNHTSRYSGENITINISNDGKVSTAYGSHRYTVNDF